MKTPNGLTEILAVYGDPRSSSGKLSQKWYRDNVISVAVPVGFPLYYGGLKVRHVQIHRLLKNDVVSIFEEIWSHVRHIVKLEYGFDHSTEFYDNRTREKITELGWDQFGGTFAYRNQRDSNHLSLHAVAAAWDVDPEHNRQHTEGRMQPELVEIFAQHGWLWGGRWISRDPMHFQKATGY